MSISLAFYKVDSSYCDFLRQFDSKVPHAFDEKSNRPFVGVVIEHGGLEHKYYIPLTSPKSKHARMKNNLDFHKIDGGKLGALNFNNMIPVTDNEIVKIDPSKMQVNSQEELQYKTLLENQLSWCNANKEIIIKKAIKLHDMIVEGKAPENIANRCCSFSVLEQACNAWSSYYKDDKSYSNENEVTRKNMESRRLDIKDYKERYASSGKKKKRETNHEK